MNENVKNNDILSSVPSDLQRRLNNRRVLFIVGAGVSIGATRGEAKSWKELLLSGISYCLKKGGATEKWANRRREDLEEEDIGEWLSVADRITDRLGGPEDGRFLNWLDDTIGQLELKDGTVIHALRNLNCPISTTNYDSLLSLGTTRHPIPWNDSRKVARWLESADNGILHLHGHWESVGSIVLGAKSYWNIAGDERAQVVQKLIGMQYSIVLVGCGDTTEDPNIGRMLAWMSEHLKSSPIDHYRLCKSDELETLKKRHRPEDRIFPLSYGDSHESLGPWLKALKEGLQEGDDTEDD